MNQNPTVAIVPAPTDEEAAAIVAAVELAWPRPVMLFTAGRSPSDTPLWRWSGRWWANGLQRGRRV